MALVLHFLSARVAPGCFDVDGFCAFRGRGTERDVVLAGVGGGVIRAAVLVIRVAFVDREVLRGLAAIAARGGSRVVHGGIRIALDAVDGGAVHAAFPPRRLAVRCP